MDVVETQKSVKDGFRIQFQLKRQTESHCDAVLRGMKCGCQAVVALVLIRRGRTLTRVGWCQMVGSAHSNWRLARQDKTVDSANWTQSQSSQETTEKSNRLRDGEKEGVAEQEGHLQRKGEKPNFLIICTLVDTY
jgi:hypothetical protein